MNNYQIKITLISDTLIGSGEGYGTIIDTDIIQDEMGLPYIPAKRIKGILLESAEMLNAMFENFNLSFPTEKIFGIIGQTAGELYLNNLYIENYEEITKWLVFLKFKSPLINKQRILNQLTSIRHSTAIDSDTKIAKEHSLRTERVINKNLAFTGEVEIDSKDEKYLSLICQNIRRMGTKRNRGLGEVKVEFLRDNQNFYEEALSSLTSGKVS